MCGIFAYSGPKKANQVLIEGLKKLEYRGYDSAGIAFFDQNKVKRLRVCGGVEFLENQIALLSQTQAQLGIGHTRWATHGRPSESNAHPHKAGPVYVVHNGVIENIKEIQKILPKTELISETDTEWIPHLIYHFLKTESVSFFKAVLKTVSLLKGSYAVVCLYENKPYEMIAFKSGPPLIAGKSKGEFFISSDPQALQDSQELYFLEEKELLHFNKGQIKIFNFQGEELPHRFSKISAKERENLLEPSKEGQAHFMLKEILEQAKRLSHIIKTHTSSNKIQFKISDQRELDWKKEFGSSSRLLILACGSSYFAGLFAKSILEEVSEIPTQVEMASEFIYKKFLWDSQNPVLFISQSGETADILTALRQIRPKGIKSLSLCNVKNSSLARKSDLNIDMMAGVEVAVASTKSFSSSLLSLLFLAFSIAKSKKLLPAKEEEQLLDSLLKFPKQLEKLLHCDQFFGQIMEKLKNFKNFFYLGRGGYYPIALEGALKLKEIAYLHAEAYPAGEMKHGPLALIDKNTAIIALMPPAGLLYQKSFTNIKESLSRGACLISIGGDEDMQATSDYFLPLPKTHPLLRPLLSLIPLQMMAYYISKSYGYNVDRPRNLAKSVTVE